jgi:hypothetical protein
MIGSFCRRRNNSSAPIEILATIQRLAIKPGKILVTVQTCGLGISGKVKAFMQRPSDTTLGSSNDLHPSSLRGMEIR